MTRNWETGHHDREGEMALGDGRNRSRACRYEELTRLAETRQAEKKLDYLEIPWIVFT